MHVSVFYYSFLYTLIVLSTGAPACTNMITLRGFDRDCLFFEVQVVKVWCSSSYSFKVEVRAVSVFSLLQLLA
jgi:hypothetical protein